MYRTKILPKENERVTINDQKQAQTERQISQRTAGPLCLPLRWPICCDNKPRTAQENRVGSLLFPQAAHWAEHGSQTPWQPKAGEEGAERRRYKRKKVEPRVIRREKTLTQHKTGRNEEMLQTTSGMLEP